MGRYPIYKGFAVIGFITMAILAVGFVVMSLWNALMPDIFGLPSISFFQAIGLLILSRLLFGGFPKDRHRDHNKRHKWKARMKKKWANMDPEEKQRFKEKMSKWRHHGCFPNEMEEEEEKRNPEKDEGEIV